MQGWALMARALMGGAALALAGLGATASKAQDAAVPRIDGYAELERLPDWSGVWTLGIGVGGRAPVPPVLTPAAQARLDAFRAKQAAEGVDQTRQVKCIPPGMPSIMRQPYPLEILFTPNRVTILAETYTQVRRIYTDGRPLPEDPDLLFNGYSVGRWDGDTLLVDTVGFSPVTEMAPGIAHGENMRIHERMWLESPNVLRIETTITDPDVLAEPLVQQATFRKEPTWEIREYVCEENNRLTDEEGGANIDLDLEFDPEDPFGPPPDEE